MQLLLFRSNDMLHLKKIVNIQLLVSLAGTNDGGSYATISHTHARARTHARTHARIERHIKVIVFVISACAANCNACTEAGQCTAGQCVTGYTNGPNNDCVGDYVSITFNSNLP